MKKPPKETKKHPTSLFPNGKGYDNKLESVRVTLNQEQQHIFLENTAYPGADGFFLTIEALELISSWVKLRGKKAKPAEKLDVLHARVTILSAFHRAEKRLIEARALVRAIAEQGRGGTSLLRRTVQTEREAYDALLTAEKLLTSHEKEHPELKYMIIKNTGKEKDRHFEQGLVVVKIEPGRKGKEAEASYIDLANKMAKEKKAKS